MDIDKQIESQEQRVREETQKLLEMQRARPGRKIQDYMLATPEGSKPLSSFFNGKSEMLLVHNMGKKCVYCTLWGDGLTGFSQHLQDRAALLMVNSDSVSTQTEFAKSRGWNFPLASTEKSSLPLDLGFHDSEKKTDWPGVSVITRDADGQLYQRGNAGFGPGDLFCAIWNFIDLLPSNTDWSPKYKY